MPKKFKGENTKATEARARKAAVQNEAAEKRRQEAEDALWVDENKHLERKTQRKVCFYVFNFVADFLANIASKCSTSFKLMSVLDSVNQKLTTIEIHNCYDKFSFKIS